MGPDFIQPSIVREDVDERRILYIPKGDVIIEITAAKIHRAFRIDHCLAEREDASLPLEPSLVDGVGSD